MDRTKQRQRRRVSVGLTGEEYARLRKAFASSGCRTLTEYGRRMLLRSPSGRRRPGGPAATLAEELPGLRQALEKAAASLSGTMGQGVPPDGRNRGNPYAALEVERKILADKITQIKSRIQKIAETCLQ